MYWDVLTSSGVHLNTSWMYWPYYWGESKLIKDLLKDVTVFKVNSYDASTNTSNVLGCTEKGHNVLDDVPR